MSREKSLVSPRLPMYEPSGVILFRAPLLPIETYLAMEDRGPSPTNGVLAVSGQGGADPLALIGMDPWVRLALAVGSRSAFDAWLRGSRRGVVDDQLKGKLLRYLIRMSMRSTPYGLFAGVAFAAFGDRTDLELGAGPPGVRTRPDMGWLMRLLARAEAKPEVRRKLHLVANPSARVRAGRVVLADRSTRTDSDASAEVTVRRTAPVLRVLELAREPIPYDALTSRLVQTTGAGEGKVEKLLSELWEQTFLLTDLQPSLTSVHAVTEVAARLRSVDPAGEESLALTSLLHDLSSLEVLEPEAATKTYCAIFDRARAVIDNAPDPPLQVDMVLPLAGRHVGRAVGLEVARAAELLLRLSPTTEGPLSLTAFRQAWTARYNDGREVPLLELLDPETGLGPLGSLPGQAGTATPSTHGGPASSSTWLANIYGPESGSSSWATIC